MRIWYIKKVLKYLNANCRPTNYGDTTIWVLKDKVVALWDNDGLEIAWDILKEAVLLP